MASWVALAVVDKACSLRLRAYLSVEMSQPDDWPDEPDQRRTLLPSHSSSQQLESAAAAAAGGDAIVAAAAVAGGGGGAVVGSKRAADAPPCVSAHPVKNVKRDTPRNFALIAFDLETHDWREKPEKNIIRGEFGHVSFCGGNVMSYPKIVQIAWHIRDVDGKVVAAHSMLIKDVGWISRQARAVHHITSAEAKAKGVPLKEALKLFMLDVAKLEQCTGQLVAHHLEHDAIIVRNELERCDMSQQVPLLERMTRGGFCTMETAFQAGRNETHPLREKFMRQQQKSELEFKTTRNRKARYYPDFPSLRVTWLALVGPVWDLKAAHDAAWDAMRAAEVYQKMRSLTL
eukprot:SAG25_NODE_588_length_6733_cov_7.918300_3_plen_345_part_00